MADLIIPMEQPLIEKAQEYAKAHNTSVPELVRAFVNGLVDEKQDMVTDENHGSLFDAIKDLPKASYHDDPLELQQQMRNEWS